jgi:toxin ParE1/3/4
LFIGTQPEMGRVVPEVGDPAVREIVHGAYRIIYELYHDPDAVFILRFWHGARGTPEL